MHNIPQRLEMRSERPLGIEVKIFGVLILSERIGACELHEMLGIKFCEKIIPHRRVLRLQLLGIRFHFGYPMAQIYDVVIKRYEYK